MVVVSSKSVKRSLRERRMENELEKADYQHPSRILPSPQSHIVHGSDGNGLHHHALPEYILSAISVTKSAQCVNRSPIAIERIPGRLQRWYRAVTSTRFVNHG